MLKKLSTLDKLHYEVDAVSFLEDVVHPNNERVVDLVKDELLDLKRLERLMLNHNVFADAFHSIASVRDFVPHEVNFAKSTSSNYA